MNTTTFIIFGTVSFVTGLAIAFKTMSNIVNENILFSSFSNAMLTYVLGISFAITFTILSFSSLYGLRGMFY